MTEEQLAAVRRYTSAEVVKMLNIPVKWLRELVRERRVPHQRTGPTKGVWFTAADVVQIGEMLPSLMAHRGGNQDGPVDEQLCGGIPWGSAEEGLSADKLAEWAQLAVHQRRPRRAPA